MGRQVNVSLQTLLQNGCILVPNRKVHDDILDDLTLDPFVQEWLTVVIPNVGVIQSDWPDILGFDCRNEHSNNYWVEEWLISNNIPYNAD